MELDGTVQYISTINIGTPPRALNFVIDTGSSDILVLLKNRHTSESKELLDEKSSTFARSGKFDIKYGAGRCSGYCICWNAATRNTID